MEDWIFCACLLALSSLHLFCFYLCFFLVWIAVVLCFKPYYPIQITICDIYLHLGAHEIQANYSYSVTKDGFIVSGDWECSQIVG